MAVLEESIYITSDGEQWLESELLSEAEANDVTLEDLIAANDLTLKETEEEEVEEVEAVETYVNAEGEEWSIDEITSAAEDNNVSVDDLLVANDLKLQGEEIEEEATEQEVEKETKKKGVEAVEEAYQKGLNKINAINAPQEQKDEAIRRLDEVRKIGLKRISTAKETKKTDAYNAALNEETAEIIGDGGIHDWMLHGSDIKFSDGTVITDDDDDIDFLFRGGVDGADLEDDVVPQLKIQYPGFDIDYDLNLLGNENITITAKNGESIELFPEGGFFSSGRTGTKQEIEDIKRKLGGFINKHGVDARDLEKVSKIRDEIGEKAYNTTESEGGLKINKDELDAINYKYSIERQDKEGKFGMSLTDDLEGFFFGVDKSRIDARYDALKKTYNKTKGGDKWDVSKMYREAKIQILNEERDRVIADKESDIYSKFVRANGTLMEGVLRSYQTKKHDESFKSLALEQTILNERREELPKSEDVSIIKQFAATYNNPDKEFKYSEGDTLLQLENGKIINQQTFDKFLLAQANIEAKENILYEDQNKLLDNIVEAKTDEAGKWDLLRREYSLFDKSMDTVVGGFSDIVVEGSYFIGRTAKYVSPIFWANEATKATTGVDVGFGMDKVVEDYMGANMEKYRDWRNKTREGYAKDVSYENAFDSPYNFGIFALQETMTQIPIITTMIATGGTAGPLIIGASSAGGVLADYDIEERKTGKKTMSEWEKIVKSTAFGATEAIIERFTTIPILRTGKRILTQGGKSQILSYKRGIKEYYKENAVKHFVYDPLLEAGGEGLTTGVQNLIEGKPIGEGMAHSLFSGLMIGGGMSGSSFVVGRAMLDFSDQKTLDNFRENVQKIDKLKKYRTTVLDDKNKLVLDDKIKKLEDENATSLEALEGRMSEKIGTNAYNTFMELTNSQERLRAQAEALLSDTKIDKKLQQELLGELKEEFDEVQRKRDLLRDPEMFGNELNALKFSEKLDDVNEYSEIKQIAIEKVKASKTEGPAYKPTNKEIDAAAYDVFLDRKIDENIDKANRNTSKKTDIIGLQTKQDGVNFMENIKDDLLADGMTEADYFNVIQGIKDGTTNGFNFKGTNTGKMLNVVFKDNAIGNERMDISTHEPGHAVFTEIFGDKNVDWDGMSAQIALYLQNTNPKLLTRMQFRGDARRGSEEFVTEFMEEVARDTKGERIKLNKKENKPFVNILGFMMNNSLKEAGKDYTVDFKSETEIVNFVIGLGRSISQGTLTQADVIAAKEGVVAKKVSKPKKDTKPADKTEPKKAETKQSKSYDNVAEKMYGVKWDNLNREEQSEVVDAVEGNYPLSKIQSPVTEYDRYARKMYGDKWDNLKRSEQSEVVDAVEGNYPLSKIKKVSEVKFSKTELKEVFDKITGPAENLKFESKEQFKKSSEFFDGLLEIEQTNTLDGSIGNTVSSAYLDMNPKFIEDVKKRISDKYQSEYDASKNSLFGWLLGKNPIVNFAAGDIQNINKKKPKTTPIERKVGGEDSKVTVGERLVSKEISPEDATDVALMRDRLKKIKPQTSKIAKKLGLTPTQENLVKRDIINYLRSPKRPSMDSPKKFFKGFVDHMSATTGARLYDIMPNKKGMKAFLETFADDLIALNKVDPAVMRRSNWDIFYEMEIESMDTGETQKAIDEGRIPESTSLTAGNTLWKTLNPTPAKVVEYLMNIRQDQLKRKLPKFFAEVLGKNEFNDIVDNPVQPAYTPEGKIKKGETIDLKENITKEEAKVGKPKVKDIIARPGGVKFSKNFDSLSGEGFASFIKKLGVKIPKEIRKKDGVVVDVDGQKRLIDFAENILPKYFPTSKIISGGTWGNTAMGKGMWFSSKLREKIGKEFSKNKTKDLEIDIVKSLNTALASAGLDSMKTAPNKFVNEKFSEKVDNNYRGLETFIDQSYKLLKENPQYLGEFLAMLKGASTSSSHFWRNFSQVVGKDLNWNFDKLDGRGEHALVSNEAAEFMTKSLLRALNDPAKAKEILKTTKTLLKNNYFQILIPVSSDFKLTHAYLVDSMPDGFWKSWKEALESGDVNKAWSVWSRYFNSEVSSVIGPTGEAGFNPNTIMIYDSKSKKQMSLADSLDIGRKQFGDIVDNPNFVEVQQQVIYEWSIRNPKYQKSNYRQKILKNEIKLSKLKFSASKPNIKSLDSSGIVDMKKLMPNSEMLREAGIMDKALQIARDPNAPVKKIRVFDFDDTLARTKSKVSYTMPDGKKGKITPAEFAKRGNEMEAEGATWDFSEFSEVIDGKKGPLFTVAEKIQEVRGTEDVFVLTARPQEAAGPISEFLNSLGLNIPINNITGLADSSPLAKSGWIVDKAAEGYNDFYFADDHMANVKAVKKVLDVIDVKGKVQQAKVKFSQTVDEKFNEIIEDKTSIKAFKEFSPAQAKLRGKNKGRFKFFVPPSADDFVGLLYHLLGKGKKGDAQMAWFKEHLLDPYARAMADITRDRVQMMADFQALKKNLKNIPKNLRKEAFDGYTYENVARIYAWNKQGSNIPGLSKADLAKVEAFVAKNPEIQVFADQLIDITKGSGYSIPTDSWLSGTITTDLVSVLNNNKRKIYLEQWQNNIDLIFSAKNLNKLEAAFGSNYREALENMLTRMKSGNNKSTRGSDRLANRFLDYVNNSVGTVMFFNMRSAVLQLISSVNFINWGDNNIIAAGKAFADQKQYWKDFMTLMNSEFLVDRRNGLQINVSESEIADAAATSKNKAKGVIAYILKKGFLPTQFADSFAIASGGATFYRNKVNRYIKEGMSQKEAEAKAFNDFREIAEESQQSSRPDRISQQQASGLGRIILAFANTPMQYTRLIKKATLDLANGRGDWKSNVSKIVYYAAVQNIIFNALQQAIFAIAWGEDDEETDKAKKEKMYSVANGMLDSILRGTGIAGGVLSVVKNIAMEIYDRSGRKRPEYAMVALRLLDISPPIDVKVSKLRQAANNYEYNKDLIQSKGFAIDNPAWLSMGYVLSSTLNIPLDRLILKMNNVKFALDSDEETWKRIAAALGYPEWQLRSAGELQDYLQLRKQERKIHKSLGKWEVIDGDEIEGLNKSDQVDILTKIGLSKDEIKDLKKEEDRVNRILTEYDKDKKKITKILDTYRPAKELSPKMKKQWAYSEEEKIKVLKNWGYTDEEIAKMTTPEAKIKAILKRENEENYIKYPDSPAISPVVEEEKEEEKKVVKKTERKKILKDDRTTAQTRLYKLRKADQVDTLASLGLSDAQIKALKYEEDRVREIERLYEEKNN